MMKKISVASELSYIYTNHCIQATSITVLDSQGFEARHIMSISRHRSENSLRSYCQTDLGTKRKMLSNLADYVYSKQLKPKFDFQVNINHDGESSSTESTQISDIVQQQQQQQQQQRNCDVHPMSKDMLLQQSSSQSITKSSSSLKKMQKCLLENYDGVTFNNCVFRL